MMKDQTGIVQTMPKKELVDFNVAMTAERLMRNGIDPNSLKNANQVENAINQIEAPKKQKTIGEARGIRSTKSAKVFDLEGKEIDPRSKIMGGKQSETEAEIVARLNEENRKTVSKIKNRQKMVDDAIDNVSPGFSGDRKVDAELVAEDIAKRMGKVYDDLPQTERLDLYDQAYRGLTKKKFDPEDMAQGGRAGFKVGGIDKARRAFLKTLGAVGAGIGALKTGLLGLGKGTTKQVAKEVITTPNAPGKPEWFDALVTRVINEGEDVTKGFATKERELVHTKQINDFAEVTVYRDLDTNTTTVNYGAKLRKDPTKPYERGNISRAVNDPDQIDLVVKGSEDIEPTIIQNEKGFVRRRGTKSSAEFEAYESEPRVVNYDGDMEFDGTNVVNNVDDLMEDVSPLKEYATGKKLTSKEAAKASEKRDKYQKFLEDPVEQANYLESKYGPGPEPDDFASGGIARMLGE
jgi:hypothetical protein